MSDADSLPLIAELSPPPEIEQAFQAFAAQPHCLFLDSSLRRGELGRHSFLAADPFDWLAASIGDADPLALLGARLSQFAGSAVPELPPFQGGAAGLLSYDLGRSLEEIPAPKHDEFAVPTLAVGLYDVVLAFDHAQDRAWIISQGFPETAPSARRRRAKERLEMTLDWLRTPPRAKAPRPAPDMMRPLDVERLATQHPVAGKAPLTSNFTAQGYRAAVQRAIDYIFAGDIFQVNLAQRLLHPAADEATALYLRLRRRNPATFAGYFDTGPVQIVSASPERLLQARSGWIEARPIKGTRGRPRHAEADLFSGDELRESEKDIAENVMIVDLLRNDLSRVCLPDSVRVSQLCGLEVYEFVQHLVSVVRGKLAPGKGPLDAVRAAFPGGSIVGCPKVRAMEIIAELEPTARGAYCGSLGYVGFDGSLDMSILIRTITAARGWWQLPVGGGIVAQSHPEREYEETWQKAAGLLRALS